MNFRITKEKLTYDLLMAVSITIIPYIFFAHLLFDKYDEAILIFGESIEHGYSSTSTMVWFLTSYLSSCLLLTIFFWNTTSTWKYFLLIPIFVEFTSFLNVAFFSANYYQVVFSFEGLVYYLSYLGLIILLDLRLFRQYSTCHIEINLKDFLKALDLEKMNAIINTARNTIALKSEFSNRSYSYRLYHIRTIIESNYFSHSKLQKSRNWKSDLPVVFVIVLFSFFLYADILFPISEKEINFLWFEIGSFGFNDIQSFLWYFCRKIAILGFLIIWFKNNNNWWRWMLLSPIFLYAYQIFEIFISEATVEAMSNLILTPIVIFLLLITLIIVKFLDRRNLLKRVWEKLSKELDSSISAICKSQAET